MSQTTTNQGTLTEFDGGCEIHFERRLHHHIDKVWAAISTPERMQEWLATATTFEAVSGAPIELRWQNTDLEGNYAIARGRITEIDPPRTIEYDTDIHGLIRWELEERGDGCLLRLTVRHDLPDEYHTVVLAGWHVHIDFLEDALDGQPVSWDPWPMDRWEVHHREYEAALS